MNTNERQQYTMLVFAGIFAALWGGYWVAGKWPHFLSNMDIQPWLKFVKRPVILNIPAFLVFMFGGSKIVRLLMREADAQTLKERQKEASWLAKRTDENKDDSKKYHPIL